MIRASMAMGISGTGAYKQQPDCLLRFEPYLYVASFRLFALFAIVLKELPAAVLLVAGKAEASI